MENSPNYPFQWKNIVNPLTFLVIVISFVGDQLTKWLVIQQIEIGDRIEVTSFLNWVHTKNRGAAFGMFHGASESFRIFLFGGMTLACIAFIVYWVGTTPSSDRWQRWGLLLILGSLGERF